MFSSLFFHVFYQPILNAVVWLYNVLPGHDLALAIIGVTIVIKLILWPLSQQSVRAQRDLQAMQPKIEAIKKEYADNREEQAKAMMALYREHKINPFSSCLPLLIQLPFFFAVFKVLREIGTNNKILEFVYGFIHRPEMISSQGLFGLIDLAKPSYVLAILAGAAQFWQAKMLSHQRPPVHNNGARDEDFAAILNKQMLYMMPIMTVVIGFTFPGGLSLYWLVLTLLTVLQQYLVFRSKKAEVK